MTFDVPSAGISVPGHIQFIAPGQINAQVPWELMGQSSVQMKVAIGYQSNSNVVTVPLSDYAPAFFEYPIGSGNALAFDGSSTSVLGGKPGKTRHDYRALYVRAFVTVGRKSAVRRSGGATHDR